MTNLMEPRQAVDTDNVEGRDALQDGELAGLIRRWMSAGTKVQERVRRESALRVAPEPVAEPTTESVAEPVMEAAAAEATYVVDTLLDAEPRETVTPRFPPLPRRSTPGETEQVHRVALLIDARRVSADDAAALLARLGQHGAVNVCRAYADWNRSDLGDWVAQMRREGLHSFHQFADDDDQALVAMTIDAVDIARDAMVDEVVIAGDLTSALPLVHRLHAAGVRVVAAGSGHTPHDVRAACHEFIDTSTITDDHLVGGGRHRA